MGYKQYPDNGDYQKFQTLVASMTKKIADCEAKLVPRTSYHIQEGCRHQTMTTPELAGYGKSQGMCVTAVLYIRTGQFVADQDNLKSCSTPYLVQCVNGYIGNTPVNLFGRF